MRNGANPQKYEMTLAEIADELGVTKSAIEQTEKKALRKLRKALEAKGLTATDLDCFDDSGTVQWLGNDIPKGF